MLINRFQNNTSFCAKLNITGHTFDDSKLIRQLSQKAKNIGLESDVIELKFKPHTPKSALPGEIVENFRARFLPEGTGGGLEKRRDRIYADNYTDLWKQEKEVVTDYIDRLQKRV